MPSGPEPGGGKKAHHQVGEGRAGGLGKRGGGREWEEERNRMRKEGESGLSKVEYDLWI